ncbi:hypothetical protein C656_02530 [Enterococcus hirae 57-03-H11]|nr:hypothetical protein F522_03535 [Enterococcus hirae 81-15-F4]OWW61898.1 hypothetical protein B645_03415 [Enterococcus hirae 88-15-E09]OWW68620.1 hypothetical protein C656_02530 [Enterococcus hirae 57-03-H11]PCE07467.1 hypothetical protein CKY13_04780 [Enterococcus hirae]ROZ09824.1 hypothetical protein EGX06_13010 [Enterococcus hirae]
MLIKKVLFFIYFTHFLFSHIGYFYTVLIEQKKRIIKLDSVFLFFLISHLFLKKLKNKSLRKTDDTNFLHMTFKNKSCT